MTTENERALERYFAFCKERHNIWEARQSGLPQAEWTADPVLRSRKFTNVFRVLDRGSQFLLEMIQSDPRDPLDQAWRCFMYRYTNRPEPWVAFHAAYGRYPVIADLSGTLTSFWDDYAQQRPILGPAYYISTGPEGAGQPTWRWAVSLSQMAVTVLPKVLEQDTVKGRCDTLITLPRVGQFMAMQIVTDLGWCDGATDENSFVYPGPGSARGIKRIEPTVQPRAMSEFIMDLWQEHQRRDDDIVIPHPEMSAPRTLSLMDVQNTLCEFDKHERWAALPIRPTDYRSSNLPTAPLRVPAPWCN